MAISQVIAFIEEEYDSEDGVPLAWIVFADTLAGRGKAARRYQRESLVFHRNRFVQEGLPENAIDGFKEKLSHNPVVKKAYPTKKLNLETGNI